MQSLLKKNTDIQLLIKPLNYTDNIWYVRYSSTFFFESILKNEVEYFQEYENINNLFYGCILGGDVVDEIYLENICYPGERVLIYKMEE